MTLRLRSEDTSFLQITTATNLADYLQNIGLPPVCRDKGVLEGRLATKIVLLENLFSLVNNLAISTLRICWENRMLWEHREISRQKPGLPYDCPVTVYWVWECRYLCWCWCRWGWCHWVRGCCLTEGRPRSSPSCTVRSLSCPGVQITTHHHHHHQHFTRLQQQPHHLPIVLF